MLGGDPRNFYFQISEQTALNHAAWALRERTALLPATVNWFCGKGTPAWDAARGLVVEPHPPHAPIGIVHLAGVGMKGRVWDLPVVGGGRVSTMLTRDAVLALRQSSP